MSITTSAMTAVAVPLLTDQQAFVNLDQHLARHLGS